MIYIKRNINQYQNKLTEVHFQKFCSCSQLHHHFHVLLIWSYLQLFHQNPQVFHFPHHNQISCHHWETFLHFPLHFHHQISAHHSSIEASSVPTIPSKLLFGFHNIIEINQWCWETNKSLKLVHQSSYLFRHWLLCFHMETQKPTELISSLLIFK